MGSERKRVVGERIRALRKARGWSRERLAEAASVHSSHLGGVERGEHNSSLELLGAVADALGVSLGSLVEDEAPGTPAALRKVVAQRARGMDTEQLRTLLRLIDVLHL